MNKFKKIEMAYGRMRPSDAASEGRSFVQERRATAEPAEKESDSNVRGTRRYDRRKKTAPASDTTQPRQRQSGVKLPDTAPIPQLARGEVGADTTKTAATVETTKRPTVGTVKVATAAPAPAPDATASNLPASAPTPTPRTVDKAVKVSTATKAPAVSSATKAAALDTAETVSPDTTAAIGVIKPTSYASQRLASRVADRAPRLNSRADRVVGIDATKTYAQARAAAMDDTSEEEDVDPLTLRKRGASTSGY